MRIEFLFHSVPQVLDVSGDILYLFYLSLCLFVSLNCNMILCWIDQKITSVLSEFFQGFFFTRKRQRDKETNKINIF